MNRKDRRAAQRGRGPMGPAQFERELRRVVRGDPDSDPVVAAFWRDQSTEWDVAAAVDHPDGIEALRRR
ncbi:hypothetical protein [Dietzia timorensis]|uniref:Uncharacterized protein n=1 Tax=Dietzia timorensis TaxID=499555 RepID=A0A173LKH6_9ACTN|nr:hypothetical protein [Dietzia timorensis]ANI91100.1 Hypothetical protein BJL86_0290 [Dietzia timorensis]